MLRKIFDRSFTKIFVTAVFFVFALGTLVAFRLKTSASYLKEFELELRNKSASWQNHEECLRYVIKSTLECPGITFLCEGKVPQFAAICTEGRDKSQVCSQYNPDSLNSDKFGVKECQRLLGNPDHVKLTRSEKKNCGNTFQVIRQWCTGKTS